MSSGARFAILNTPLRNRGASLAIGDGRQLPCGGVLFSVCTILPRPLRRRCSPFGISHPGGRVRACARARGLPLHSGGSLQRDAKRRGKRARWVSSKATQTRARVPFGALRAACAVPAVLPSACRCLARMARRGVFARSSPIHGVKRFAVSRWTASRHAFGYFLKGKQFVKRRVAVRLFRRHGGKVERRRIKRKQTVYRHTPFRGVGV